MESDYDLSFLETEVGSNESLDALFDEISFENESAKRGDALKRLIILKNEICSVSRKIKSLVFSKPRIDRKVFLNVYTEEELSSYREFTKYRNLLDQEQTDRTKDLVQRIREAIRCESTIQTGHRKKTEEYRRSKKENKASKWSPEDDLALLKAIEKYGKSWQRVSACVGSKTNKECRNRYAYVLSSEGKGRWSSVEEERLCSAVALFGVAKWSRISEIVKTRSPIQCREHYLMVTRKRMAKAEENA